jgi:hypothetical protein
LTATAVFKEELKYVHDARLQTSRRVANQGVGSESVTSIKDLKAAGASQSERLEEAQRHAAALQELIKTVGAAVTHSTGGSNQESMADVRSTLNEAEACLEKLVPVLGQAATSVNEVYGNM